MMRASPTAKTPSHATAYSLQERIETYLLSKADALFAPAGTVVKAGDLDAVHQMRVASRRLRIGLRCFSVLFPEQEVRQVQHQLRRATRLLGAIRSLDINLQLLRKAAKHIPAGTTAVQRKLTGELLASGQQHMSELHELLKTFATSHFEEHLRKLVRNSRPLADKKVLEDARDFIAKRRRQLRRRFKKCRHDERFGPAFHKLRVAAKRYRYSMETSMAIFRTSAATQVNAIKELQDYLGACHDLEELLDFLRSCRRRWEKADNPLAGRLTSVLTFFQGEHEVAFADVQKYLREDENHVWLKKVKLLLPHD